MLVITDREVSNSHGTGVLIKNIIDAYDEKINIVYCDKIKSSYYEDIKHYTFNSVGLYVSKRKILALGVKYADWFLRKFEKMSLPYIDQQERILIVGFDRYIYMISYLIMTFYPNKKYLVYIMDLGDDNDPKYMPIIERIIYKKLLKKTVLNIAISLELSTYLTRSLDIDFVSFYGPREINTILLKQNYSVSKKETFCMVGNFWIEEIVDYLDKIFFDNEVYLYWYVNQDTFNKVNKKYKFRNIRHAGFLSNENLLQEITKYKYGIIPYGLDSYSLNKIYKYIQMYSISSKILDYYICNITPLYIGPGSSSCANYIRNNNIGEVFSLSTFKKFIEKKIWKENDSHNKVDNNLMLVIKESSKEKFKLLTNKW